MPTDTSSMSRKWGSEYILAHNNWLWQVMNPWMQLASPAVIQRNREIGIYEKNLDLMNNKLLTIVPVTNIR